MACFNCRRKGVYVALKLNSLQLLTCSTGFLFSCSSGGGFLKNDLINISSVFLMLMFSMNRIRLRVKTVNFWWWAVPLWYRVSVQSSTYSCNWSSDFRTLGRRTDQAKCPVAWFHLNLHSLKTAGQF